MGRERGIESLEVKRRKITRAEGVLSSDISLNCLIFSLLGLPMINGRTRNRWHQQNVNLRETERERERERE